MHRVKRPPAKADVLGLSQVQSRMSHDNPGDEPKAKAKKQRKNAPGFQLNQAGGPLGEEFDSNS